MTTPLTQGRISEEIAEQREAYAKAVAAGGPARSHPDRGYAPYRSSVLRHPGKPLVALHDPEAVELSGPVFGVTDVTALDHDLTHAAPGRAARRADQGHRPGAGPGRPPGARPAGRDLAGQRLGSLRPPARRPSCPARSQLHRRGPLPDRRPGRVRVRHRQAGRLPLAQPRQRLASCPHPLLAVRQRLHPAADHPDVLPGGSALRLRPHPPVRHRRLRALLRLVATYDHDLSTPEWSLGYRWDIVLDGPAATWIEEGR